MKYTAALITGASSGLGRAMALELACQGTYVVGAARRGEELDALFAEIKGLGKNGEYMILDVADTGAVTQAVRSIDQRIGGLDLIVANAGVGDRVPGKRMTYESIDALLRVNFLGAIATLTAVLPDMISRKRGHVVGISSLARARGFPGHGAYCASKAGLSTFLESLRIDLDGTGVWVTNVDLGFLRSPMTARSKHPMPMIQSPEDAVKRILKGLEQHPASIEFPLPLALASHMVGLMPSSLYRMFVRSGSGSGKKDVPR